MKSGGYDPNNKHHKEYSLIQKYIENPLLIDKRKFGVRDFILIASVKPFVILFKHGFISRCICDYDTNFEIFEYADTCKHLTHRKWQ